MLLKSAQHHIYNKTMKDDRWHEGLSPHS